MIARFVLLDAGYLDCSDKPIRIGRSRFFTILFINREISIFINFLNTFSYDRCRTFESIKSDQVFVRIRNISKYILKYIYICRLDLTICDEMQASYSTCHFRYYIFKTVLYRLYIFYFSISFRVVFDQ